MMKRLMCLLCLVFLLSEARALEFNFEDGKQGWHLVEGWFGNWRLPRKRARKASNMTELGEAMLGTNPWFSGIIESPVFLIEGPEATFLLGGAGAPHACITLHTEDGKEVLRMNVPQGKAPDTASAYVPKPRKWDLSDRVGKKAFIRVWCEPTGQEIIKRGNSNIHESYVIFDNFKVNGSVDKEATKKRLKNIAAQKKESIDAIKSELGDIIFVVRKFYREGHWYANIGHWSGDANKRMFHDGARLCRMNIASGKVETLFEDPKGGIRDPQVHYDGKKVIFSYRPGGSEYYNLYEMNLENPGKLKRITNAPFDDIEPTYTAEGKIIFVSTRCKRWVPCYYTEVAILYTCNADGSGVRQLSANVEHENTPWPLPDGRILYTRWEYVERSVMDFHHLWTTSPDGARQQIYFGNMHPGYVMIDAKPIPQSQKVVSIFSPGHGRCEHHGSVAIIDPGKGPDDKSSVQNIGWHRLSRDVYPVGRKGFLTAKQHTLTLMDYEGREEVVFSLSDEEKKQNYWCSEPRPIMARKRERVIPAVADLKKSTGTLVLEDVYVGRNMKGIKRGDIKKLLVLEYLPKSINISNWSEPCSKFTHNHETILGTVPVEKDGSASFEVPALTPIFLAALDENDLCIKRMQSFLTVQPGEMLGCVGCHEERMQAPKTPTKRSIAMTKKPGKITPIKDIPYVFDFPRDIQPILDKHCVACHDYDKTEKGGPRSGGVVLTGDRNGMWSHSYTHLTWKQVTTGSRMGNNAPYTTGSGGSPLMKKIDGTHPSKSPTGHKVKLSEHEKKMIRLWIDTGGIFSGTLAGEGTGMIYFQLTRRGECYKWFSMPKGWPEKLKAANEVVNNRCVGCHEGKSSPRIFNLDITRERKDKGQKVYSSEARLNLTRTDKSLLLLAPLAQKAGGYGKCGRKQKQSVLADKNDEDYKKLLAYVDVLKEALNRNKRFDMAGFKPNEHYVREMKRYGIIPESYNRATDDIDVYEMDRKYWDTVRWKPE